MPSRLAAKRYVGLIEDMAVLGIVDKLTIICGVLAVVSILVIVIRLLSKSVKANRELQKRVETAGALMFVGSIGLVFAFGFTVQRAALKHLERFCQAEPQRIRLTIDNEVPEDVAAVLAAIQNIRPEYLHSEDVFMNSGTARIVSLIKGEETINLRLVQKSQCREYYVYYPGYWITNKNPLGIMNFW